MTHNLRADTVEIRGHQGDPVEAYLAVPTDVTTAGAVVVIHHMPGYDDATKEIVRRFAAHGFHALAPNLYHRVAPGASPDDAAATARHLGGVPDDQLVGDVEGAMGYLTALATSNNKVAVIGFCSGGRQAFLAGCRLPLDGVVDCYGAFVTVDPPAEFPTMARAVIHETGNLSSPLLGLFGAEDSFPSPEQNDQLAAELTRYGKDFTFRTYPGAGHAFLAVDRPSYRPEVAVEAWTDILAFLERTVS